MSRPGLTLLAAVIATLLAAPSASAAVLPADRVIVEWAPGASPAERRAARDDAEVDFGRDLGSRRFQLVETEPGQTPGEAVRELESDPAVALAERDGYASPDAVPDDPLFDQLWGLRNSGLGIDGFVGAVAGADIGASSAWERTVGTPATVVAVLDSGYRFEHPDLANVAWTNPGETLDGADNDGNGIVDDLHGADFVGPDAEAPAVDGNPTDDDLISGGHGVHTAGTIGAEGNNGIGIAGVAQDVSIMPLRVCSRIGGENDCLLSAAVAAVNYAGAKGARVANMSFGTTTFTPVLGNAIAANPQTLFVVSAGNEGNSNDLTPRHPCTVDPLGGGSAVDNVVCVAATDQADKLASFSNWGARTVDLGAPGTQTLSAYPTHAFVEETFEVDDFAEKWSASGPAGGFFRTAEAPLTSFGISDSPGTAPVAGSTRAVTSVPMTMAPGANSCLLEFDRYLRLGEGLFSFEVRLDGTTEVSVDLENPGPISGRQEVGLGDALSAGGEVDLRFTYTADSSPGAGEGVWIDDVELRCRAGLDEADGYRFANGTSMAAPHVTGAAALLFSLKPSATVTEVRRGLLDSVDPLASLAGKTVTGGRLDAAAALDLFDSAPPPKPALTATSPASPADNTQPRLIGSAQRGTAVEVYANATCSGAPVVTAPASHLASPGIAVTAPSDTTTQFSVRATDLAPHTSPCSAPISYTHAKVKVPDPPPSGGGQPPADTPTPPSTQPPQAGPPPVPAKSCVVPRLAGKALAQAKAALRQASCKLGTVRKPRPRPGKSLPPLVVKSSTPGAGASPAGGKVTLRLGPKPRKARR